MKTPEDPIVKGINLVLSFLPPADELSDEENAKVAEIKGLLNSIEKKSAAQNTESATSNNSPKQKPQN